MSSSEGSKFVITIRTCGQAKYWRKCVHPGANKAYIYEKEDIEYVIEMLITSLIL